MLANPKMLTTKKHIKLYKVTDEIPKIKGTFSLKETDNTVSE